MDRHSFRAADVASTSPRYELGKVAFSRRVLKRKKSQRFGDSSFSKFHNTRQKNLFPTPRTVLQRAKKSLCSRSQFRTLFLPHRFVKIRPSHQRPVSIEFLTIFRIPEFPKSEQNQKSCGNVWIWRKSTGIGFVHTKRDQFFFPGVLTILISRSPREGVDTCRDQALNASEQGYYDQAKAGRAAKATHGTQVPS